MNIDNLYCLIKVLEGQKIELYCINNEVNINISKYNYPLCFTAFKSNFIIELFCLYDNLNFLSTYHALYLGQELYKAEVSYAINQIYIQS
uniref:DUF4346 domain-containing protein n=1 Tax=Acrosorium ciliolatum TaxID=1550622 RepID=A0A1Z1M2E9_9FLOR|nr:hypothetical protein [Acrosorium ciliolatum]ARW59964.1 hypothetical protein [Acrosorium ciliolatum]